jgi:microcystin-dependent protein
MGGTMSDQFLGEIRMVAFNFAPTGWLQCNGQTLAISQYAALFSLLGTTYGGNGTSTFQVPNLQGRVPIHVGQSAGTSVYVQGEVTGAESVTLTAGQMPVHNHALNCVNNSAADSSAPSGCLPGSIPFARGQTSALSIYNTATAADSTMRPTAIGTAGGTTPVPVIQPVCCVNFIIATVGLYPTRN